MRIRALPTLALMLSLVLPTTVQAGGIRHSSTGYARRDVELGGGAHATLESIVFQGSLLTSTMRHSQDWAALAAHGVSEAETKAASEAHPGTATAYKVMGRRYTAFNSIGWVVVQYTIWQEFGYTGSAISWFPAPYFDAEANWGWELRSHTEAATWIVNPTYRRTRGDFFFKQALWTPVGNINQSEVDGWVALYYRANGSWNGTNF
jgi:hypothetical protein